MSDVLPPAIFDPNIWYHISELRVDNYTKPSFQSSLQLNNNTLKVWPRVKQYWQLLPVSASKGRYALRLSQTGIAKQLAVCHVPDEIDASRTQPCLLDSHGGEEQMWDVADWGDESYRFVNMKNGSDYVLDIHPGNPLFLNSQQDVPGSVVQVGQHWIMTSASDINDGAYSTTFTQLPTSTATAKTTQSSSSGSADSSPDSTKTDSSTSSTSTSDSSDSSTPESSSEGLSTGAKAGIGVGVSLGVIAFLLVAFLLLRRRRRRNAASGPVSGPAEMAVDDKAYPIHNGPKNPPAPQEMSTEGGVYSTLSPALIVPQSRSPPSLSELDSTVVGSSPEDSPETTKTNPAV